MVTLGPDQYFKWAPHDPFYIMKPERMNRVLLAKFHEILNEKSQNIQKYTCVTTERLVRNNLNFCRGSRRDRRTDTGVDITIIPE